jgi:hypothetical protein
MHRPLGFDTGTMLKTESDKRSMISIALQPDAWHKEESLCTAHLHYTTVSLKLFMVDRDTGKRRSRRSEKRGRDNEL